ncbi:MAG: ATP-binding protein [Anaerolineaceae bacterium]
MKRNIVEIDEEKCNGCGACADACHEGAIQMVNGKAKLINDSYCDGLGACLPHCPTGAISVIERESTEFDAGAVTRRLSLSVKKSQPGVATHTGCPGSAARVMQPKNLTTVEKPISPSDTASELSQWPVQLKLVNVNAPYFQNCDLLVAADCTAFAYANFHADFIRGRITLIGCPKLDDNIAYVEKLTRLFAENTIRSIIVVRMEVPCCGGIVQAVKQALLANSLILPYREVVIAVDGRIIN